jgi:hypothetical protein
LSAAAATEAASVESSSEEWEEDDDGLSLTDTVQQQMKGNESIEEIIVMLMDTCAEDWWTANEVHSHVSKIKGRDIPMGTVSPTLWSMRNKSIIHRDGLRVIVKSRL